MMQISPANLHDPQVIALLDVHRTSALMATPGEGGLSIYIERLREPNLTLWAAWETVLTAGGKLLGVGALSELPDAHGEIKYMHTAEAARRQGVGSTMLGYIVGVARSRGYLRISLETGSREAFAPARAMYRAHGFVDCEPFGAYERHPVSVFLTKDLGSETRPV